MNQKGTSTINHQTTPTSLYIIYYFIVYQMPDTEINNGNDTLGPTDGKKEDRECRMYCIWKAFCKFYWENEFLALVLLSILLAYAYPPLGGRYLAPHITATWIAVFVIFLLSGISLKSEELSKAFQRLKFNVFVQIFNFFVVSSLTFGFSRLMIHAGAIDKSLADGMVISTSVSITVNMVIVLTKSSGGDEAAAIFNAAFGNIVGVFLSPALVLMYLNINIDGNGAADLGQVFYKLSLRMILPIAIGQIIHKYNPPTVDFVKKNKKHFKHVQEYCLVFIVYTTFCRQFLKKDSDDTPVGDIFIMIAFIFLLLIASMTLAWYGLKLLFPNDPRLRVMGLFGCTHKSVAVGIPLINAIYENSPLVGYYTLPLLIWHPMQLVIGSFLAPKLANFVEREEDRLKPPSDLHLETNDENEEEKEERVKFPIQQETLDDDLNEKV